MIDIGELVLQLQAFRSQYAGLIRQLEGGLDIPEDRDIVEERYLQRFQDWEESQPVGHDEGAELQIEFRETIAPIWQLMTNIRQALIVHSVSSDLGKATLHAFDELAFVEHLHACVRDQPYYTLQGIDTVIALLEAFQTRSEKALGTTAFGQPISKKGETEETCGGLEPMPEKLTAPTAKSGSSPEGKPEVATMRDRTKEPNPDPESILRTYPAGMPHRRAADFRGLTIRRIQQLVDEGKLESVGEGKSRRITVASLMKRLGLKDLPK